LKQPILTKEVVMPRRFLKVDGSATFALAAIVFGAAICAGAAPAAAQFQAGYSFQLTGDPGSQIDYYPSTLGGIFTVDVDAEDVDATIGGIDVILDLQFYADSSSAIPVGGGLHSQTLYSDNSILYPDGNLSIYDSLFNPLGSGSLSSGVIYAAPGESAAAIVLDVTNYSGVGAASGLPSGYLVLQGSTENPVSLVTTNSGCYIGATCVQPYFDQFYLDWTATYQSSPYEVQGSAVPEPSTWAMMIVGFAGLGFIGWQRGRARWAAV
jgi:PEP-CTERM motif